ncbi:MAG: hypothetical protein RIE73_00055 [Coleofasciculus sp. C1-SOL-03]|uniref:hypothetical protein n=1 Tax=Coleofasciculus sp. C1-SOL-03 TaxID=3069522 RepID=UPI0032F74832
MPSAIQTGGFWFGGAIAIRGLTPESAMTLRMLDRNAKRTVMSNSCGFLRVKPTYLYLYPCTTTREV